MSLNISDWKKYDSLQKHSGKLISGTINTKGDISKDNTLGGRGFGTISWTCRYFRLKLNSYKLIFFLLVTT